MTTAEGYVAAAYQAASAYSFVRQATRAGTRLGETLAAKVAAWGFENRRRGGDHEGEVIDAFSDAVRDAQPGSCAQAFLDAALTALKAGL